MPELRLVVPRRDWGRFIRRYDRSLRVAIRAFDQASAQFRSLQWKVRFFAMAVEGYRWRLPEGEE